MPLRDVDALWTQHRYTILLIGGMEVSANELYALLIGQFSVLSLAGILKLRQPVTPEGVEELRLSLRRMKQYTKQYWQYVGHREWIMADPSIACDVSTHEGILRLLAAKSIGLQQILT